MPSFKTSEIALEVVTPEHSTVSGRLVTGTQIELGILYFATGEGACTHSHEQEQMIYVLKGRLKVSIEGEEERIAGPGDIVHYPSGVRHANLCLEEAQVLSCKGIIDGRGHRK